MKCLFTFLIIGLFLFSCSGGLDLKAGKQTFTTFCVQCHGEDGKLGVNDSKDLTASTIEFDDAVNLVLAGKGMMTPYKGLLSREEIEAVVHYVFSLRE